MTSPLGDIRDKGRGNWTYGGARINGVELDDWGSFMWAGNTIVGTLNDENDRTAFLAAIADGEGTQFPKSFISCAHALYGTPSTNADWGVRNLTPHPDQASLPVTTVASGVNLIESPVGYYDHYQPYTARGRHVRVCSEIAWRYSTGSPAMLGQLLDLPGPPMGAVPSEGLIVTYEKYTWDGDGNNPDANEEEPVLHLPQIDLGSTSWYASLSNSISSPGLNGTSYMHGVNHDDGMGVAIPAGTTFTWSFWWAPFNDPVYFYLTYFNDAGTTIAGPSLKVTATGTAASYSFTDTVPTGATCMQLKGWTGSGPSGVQGTYGIDQGLIRTVV